MLIKWQPSLPQSADIWTRILARLMEQKEFVAMAFLTINFTFFTPDISCLDNKCPPQVDCSSGNIDDVSVTNKETLIIFCGDMNGK
jgi:hypothetical protein